MRKNGRPTSGEAFGWSKGLLGHVQTFFSFYFLRVRRYWRHLDLYRFWKFSDSDSFWILGLKRARFAGPCGLQTPDWYQARSRCCARLEGAEAWCHLMSFVLNVGMLDYFFSFSLCVRRCRSHLRSCVEFCGSWKLLEVYWFRYVQIVFEFLVWSGHASQDPAASKPETGIKRDPGAAPAVKEQKITAKLEALESIKRDAEKRCKAVATWW